MRIDAYRRPFLRATLATALLATATPLTAQGPWVCGPSAGGDSTGGTTLFAGRYTLTQMSSADSSTDRAFLENLEAIGIPVTVGGPVGQQKFFTANDAYEYDDRGNTKIGDAPRFAVSWGKPVAEGSLNPADVPPEMREAATMNWCATRHGFKVRAGLNKEMRWTVEAHLRGMPPHWFKDRVYRGQLVYGTLLPGDGFPVQRYSVIRPGTDGHDAIEAVMLAANQLYTEFQQEKSMPWTSYDFVLSGAISYHDYEVEVCDEKSLFGTGLFSSKNCWQQPRRDYYRTLFGEVHKKAPRDWRVLDDRPSMASGGTGFDAFIALVGSTITVDRPSRQFDRMQGLIQAVCGTQSGCATGSADALPQGVYEYEGADDSLRIAQMCRAVHSGKDCAKAGNAFLDKTDAADSLVSNVTTARGINPERSMAQRISIGAGKRGTSTVSPQIFRACLQRATEDSIEIVDAPRPVGRPAPQYPSDSVASRTNRCVESATREGPGLGDEKWYKPIRDGVKAAPVPTIGQGSGTQSDPDPSTGVSSTDTSSTGTPPDDGTGNPPRRSKCTKEIIPTDDPDAACNLPTAARSRAARGQAPAGRPAPKAPATASPRRCWTFYGKLTCVGGDSTAARKTP